MSEYEVFRDSEGKYRWRLVSSNNEIIAQSEAYSTVSNAVRGAKDAKAVSEDAGVQHVDEAPEQDDPR